MERPAYDHVVQALIGFMPKQGRNGAPEPIRKPVVDKVAARSAALSSVAALLARTSNGGAIKTSMSKCSIHGRHSSYRSSL